MARHLGRFFFFQLYLEHLLAVTRNISRSENAFITVSCPNLLHHGPVLSPSVGYCQPYSAEWSRHVPPVWDIANPIVLSDTLYHGPVLSCSVGYCKPYSAE